MSRQGLIQAGREPLPMNYRLESTADGWKVYDITVPGAWLIDTGKGTFATEMNRRQAANAARWKE
ncbi:MAG TPA: ABC transporter substrate-binding protein [Noviherbaspirillum sp.]|nr:ABC transporter substrate-binding protein [Noviherbaspirillum sp.]